MMKKENKCKNALPTCKAFCCRAIAFSVPKGTVSPDYWKYLELHNALVKNYDEADIIVVLANCKYLNKNLNCSVFETSKQPKRCLDSYNSISKNVFYIPGCRFTTGEQPYVLTEEDLKKLFGKY